MSSNLIVRIKGENELSPELEKIQKDLLDAKQASNVFNNELVRFKNQKAGFLSGAILSDKEHIRELQEQLQQLERARALATSKSIKVQLGVDAKNLKSRILAEYNNELQLLSNKAKIASNSTAEFTNALRAERNALAKATKELHTNSSKMEDMLLIVGKLTASYYTLKTAYTYTLGRGHEFNKLLERETVGMKLLIAQNLNNVDSKGQEVTALQKFTYAQKEANKAIEIARKINIETPHNLSETLQIYKLLVPQVIKFGGTLEDVGQITKSVSVIGSAMGVEFENLVKTVDSLMSGQMKESGLQRAMAMFGLTQEKVNQTIKEGGDVVELFKEKLKQAEPAAVATAQTWQGVTSKFQNAWDTLWAEMQKPIFDGMKSQIRGVTAIIEQNQSLLIEHKEVIGGVAVGIGTFTTAMVAARVALLAFGSAMSATPWGVAITGALALASAVSKVADAEARRKELLVDIDKKLKSGKWHYDNFGVLREDSKEHLKMYNKYLKEQIVLKENIAKMEKNTSLPEQVKLNALKNLNKALSDTTIKVDAIKKAYSDELNLTKEKAKVSKTIQAIAYKTNTISEHKLKIYKNLIKTTDKEGTLRAKINDTLLEEKKIREALKGKFSEKDRIAKNLELNTVLKARKIYEKELADLQKSKTSSSVKNSLKEAKEHYSIIKDEFKIKSQLLELEVLQAKLSGKYNKLEVLQKELKLLKEQSTNGLKDFDLNKHKIDILNKQLEIQKEQKRLKEEQHNIELSIIEENSKKQLEANRKRAEAERLYQELLGNKAYAENIKYWELKNKLQEGGINLSIEQIKILEKQREAQEALTNATKSWVNALVGGVLAGEDLGDVLHNAMEGLNKSITDSFSKSITDSIIESIKTGKIADFGIFDDNGDLTSVGKQGAMALGNLFVKAAFGDNKNAQRGAEFGQAIGFALGGVTGAIGGQIGGAILGSMFGGKVSYYTRVNEDGTVEAHKRKSGGLFHSSSDKILESETRQLQMAFDQTVKAYENLLSDLFGIYDKIEVLAGKYNTGDLLNKIVPQDVIDSWTGATLTQSQIDNLKKLIAERDRVVSHFNSADFTYDYTDVERARQAVKDYAKKIGVALTTDVIEQLRGNTLDLTELQQEARKKSDEIRKAWEAYAKLKDKSFNEVFIESLQQLQQTSINVFETLYRDDKVKVLEERAKRYKKSFEDVHKTIYGDLYDGKSDRRQYMPLNKVPNQVTLENYDIMRERAIGKGATPEQVEAWNRLGQILVEDAKNADELRNAIDAKKKAEEEFRKSIAVSVRSFEDWVGTFNKSDLDKALYNRTRAEEDYKKALEEVGLKSTSTSQILELLNSANKDNLEDYQHLAEAYRENQEAQLAYNNALADSKNVADTVIKSTKDLKALMDSFNDITVNWKDYNATLGMGELGKVNYQIQQTSHSLGLVGVTFENFGSLLNGIKSDVEAGKISDDELKNWSELNRLLQQQHNIQLQNAEERTKQLKEEREEILKNRDTIRSSMENIINAQISSIKTDISSRTSSIESLQNSLSSYKPTQTVYSHDIYSAISNWSYDKNKEIENSIKTWHDQQIKALEDADKKAREQWEARKKRLQDEENLRVKNENARIDSLSEQIKLNNQLADTINSMKDSVTKTFNDLYGDTQTLEASLYDALKSGKYSDVSSLFSSYARKVQDSNLTDTEAYIEIAKANRDIQSVVAPEKRDEIKHIEARTIQIADYTSTLTEDSEAINKATVTMYEALIKQNEDNLPNLQDEVKKIFEQNKKYFDKDSDFYKFLERGATELTYTEKMEEQKKLWEKYQKEAREFNNKKLGTLEKIDLSFNKYASSNLTRVNNNTNDIKKLEAKLDKLHREQQEANKINKALLEEQRTANKLAKQTADNTKEKIIAGGVL